ncbi:putative T7SS-secreted protein [Streptomyces sp. NPDC005336]|uniref:putative T7SS-secreted protein n=1 Tax=Streptomyces sp. NPDC005336 TaxID=3157035 RepID=UPI00339DD3DA
MGGRPHDWSPVAEKDPVPGNPDRVASLGKKFRDTADVISQQIKNLKAIADVTAWDSDAGREFRKTAKGSVGKLEAAFKRYDAAADALGVKVGDEHTQNYASQLECAQVKANAALRDAKEADRHKSTAQKHLDKLTDTKDDKSKKKDFETSLATADSDIQDAKDRIEDAKTIRDNAAKKAKDSINNIIEHDSLKDKESFWGSLLDSVNEVMGTIATWCGIASLLVGWIPIIGQALAGVLGTIAMVASLVSLACTITMFLRGEADLWDIGFAALGFIMMGVGKAFGKVAGKFAGKALPRMGRAAGRVKNGKFNPRDIKKLNKIAGQADKLTGREIAQSLREPFAEIATKSGWKGALGSMKTVLRPRNWGDAYRAVSANGGVARGIAKSFSVVDASVAADLKAAKSMANSLGDISALNKISKRVTHLTFAGVTLTGSNLALDDNVNKWLHIPDWKGKLKSLAD